jgi:hypothetical protein
MRECCGAGGESSRGEGKKMESMGSCSTASMQHGDAQVKSTPPSWRFR